MEKELNPQDCFKPVFKYYKQKAVKPCLNNVVDIYKCSLKKVCSEFICVPSSLAPELKNPSKWKLYKYDEIPGLYFIPNPFTDFGKNSWINRCLKEYSCGPYKTNLLHKSDTIWTDSCAIINSTPKEKLLSNLGKLICENMLF